MSKIINTLINKKCDLPIWFMRQAGRHLPEFRKIRNNNKDFIRLCLNSKLSAKITVQPLIRSYQCAYYFPLEDVQNQHLIIQIHCL